MRYENAAREQASRRTRAPGRRQSRALFRRIPRERRKIMTEKVAALQT